MEPIRDYLKQNRLLFDGGMGTYFLSRYPGGDPRCELQNLEKPARIWKFTGNTGRLGPRR